MQAILMLSWAMSLSASALNLSDMDHSLLRGYAAAEPSGVNATIFANDPSPAAAYTAKVKIVDFDKCSSSLASDDLFYKGIIVNSYGYSEYRGISTGRYYQDYTSVKLERSGTYSSSMGIYKFKWEKTAFHTWEWLALPLDGDIRNKKDPYFTFYTWNALPQMYFPILSPGDAGLGGKKAYMLHVYPDAKLIENISTYQYYGDCGFIKPSNGGTGRTDYKRMKFEIYPRVLLETITESFLADPTEAYDYLGVDATSSESYRRSSNSFTDVNQKSLRATATGVSTEMLCGYSADVTLSFSAWREKVQKVLTWF